MKRHDTTAALLLVAAMALSPFVQPADFEVTGPDGRRILLKDDGSWRYVEDKDKEAAKDKPNDKPKVAGEVLLRVERKTEIGGSCRYELKLVNNLRYEIRSIAPTFSAHRANGVVYDSVLAIFQAIRPGDTQYREIQFRGIACQDIARVQVVGSDRCVMGDFDRFSVADGKCLARIRILPSDLVRFDK